MKTSSVLVAGATGYIGRDVVRELCDRGADVLAVVRPAHVSRPDAAAVQDALTAARPIEWAIADPASVPDFGAQRIDTVVSCLASRTGVASDARLVDYAANRRLLEIARQAGAQRFILLSAICVQKPLLAFQRAKLEFERELATSGLDYAIVRPTAFFKSLAGQIDRVRQGKPFLVFGDGKLTACKPISSADLARFIADQVDAPAAANGILPVGGPGAAITPQEQGEMLFDLLNQPARFRRVPPAMFRVAERVLAVLGRVAPTLAAKAELARIGHYYATESMLVWDAANARYAPEQTPSFGSDTLRDFYAHALRDGLAGQDPGDQRLFSRSSTK